MMAGTFLDAMQHEKGWTQRDAWLDHWTKLTSDQVKVDFLLMLKERRDRQRDDVARDVFTVLAAAWATERFVP